MKIPPRLTRALGLYALKGIEWVIVKLSEPKGDPPHPLTFKDVEGIRKQVDSATAAARASAKTVVLKRSPNRYDE